MITKLLGLDKPNFEHLFFRTQSATERFDAKVRMATLTESAVHGVMV
jgi:hypothetical protein